MELDTQSLTVSEDLGWSDWMDWKRSWNPGFTRCSRWRTPEKLLATVKKFEIIATETINDEFKKPISVEGRNSLRSI